MRNLTKQVTCSICLETFKDPKIISCFHMFCCECLEKHARVSQRHVIGELDLNLLEGEQVGCLLGIAVDTEGNIAVTDCYKHCVYIFDKNGKCLGKIGAKGQFKFPCGMTYLNDDEILIADTNNSRIQQKIFRQELL